MSILTCVCAHRDAEAIVSRHMSIWKQHTDKLLVFTPEDSRINTEERQISWGHAEHHGYHAVERFFWLLRWIEGTDFDHFIIHEYDSVSFGPVHNEAKSDDSPALWGNWFDVEPDLRWIGSSYVHPPLFMSRYGLESLVGAMGRLHFGACRGFWDRYFGACVELHGMWKGRWGRKGFSSNSIHDGNIQSAKDARADGAIHFHGIKAPDVFNALK